MCEEPHLTNKYTAHTVSLTQTELLDQHINLSHLFADDTVLYLLSLAVEILVCIKCLHFVRTASDVNKHQQHNQLDFIASCSGHERSNVMRHAVLS